MHILYICLPSLLMLLFTAHIYSIFIWFIDSQLFQDTYKAKDYNVGVIQP